MNTADHMIRDARLDTVAKHEQELAAALSEPYVAGCWDRLLRRVFSLRASVTVQTDAGRSLLTAVFVLGGLVGAMVGWVLR